MTNRYIMYNKNVYIIYKHVINKVSVFVVVATAGRRTGQT